MSNKHVPKIFIYSVINEENRKMLKSVKMGMKRKVLTINFKK